MRARRRQVRRPSIAPCASYQCVRCAEPHAVCEPMGPIRPMPIAYAAGVAGAGLAFDTPPELRAAIIDRMVRWGEALWHAVARVAGKPCYCAACINPKDPRHPWLIVDYTEAG